MDELKAGIMQWLEEYDLHPSTSLEDRADSLVALFTSWQARQGPKRLEHAFEVARRAEEARRHQPSESTMIGRRF